MKNVFCALIAILWSCWVFADPVASPAKTYWVDVRTAPEFSEGAVEGAVNIPVNVIAQEISNITEDKDADIRVYCRSGRRSAAAKETLNDMGYTNVTNEGGYEDIVSR